MRRLRGGGVDTRRILVALGAYGVPGATVMFPEEPVAAEDWTAFRLGVRHQKLAGQAVAAVDTGALPASDGQREDLHRELIHSMAHALTLESHLVRIHDRLHSLGIPFLVLKGSAVAHLDYPDPALRPFSDNDVLIPTEHFDVAIEALMELGYRRPAPQVRAGFDQRFGKGATLLADDYELDVHRTLAMGPFGYLIDLDELADSPTTYTIAGRRLLALDTEQRFLHAAYHAVIGNPQRRIQPYRDLTEMFLFGSYDHDRLRGLAERWGAGAVLARAITDTWDTFGLATDIPLLSWARSRRTSAAEARLLAVYADRTSYAAKCLAMLSMMGWRDRFEFTGYITRPDPAFAAVHGSRLAWVARGTVRALRERAGTEVGLHERV